MPAAEKLGEIDILRGSRWDAQATVAVGLGQSYVCIGSNTGSTEASTLTPYGLDLKYDEYSRLLRLPLMNEHVFQIDITNITTLSTWHPPPTTPISQIQPVVLRISAIEYG
ncbi:hypothetical protein E2P81_ATG02397 [Venturia nashicola]|nr:hypothetical protein E2P81_ATG02397 [Venturia nashicola]